MIVIGFTVDIEVTVVAHCLVEIEVLVSKPTLKDLEVMIEVLENELQVTSATCSDKIVCYQYIAYEDEAKYT